MAKKKRGRRKVNNNLKKIKLKNSTRVSLSMLFFAIFAISSVAFLKSFTTSSTKLQNDLYTYKNEYKADYTVDIISNPFVVEEKLPSGQSYVSELIKSLNMDLEYRYNGSINLPITYDYKIDAVISSEYSDSGKDYNVWKKTYNLLEKKDLNTNKDITINENINVDYQKYHNEVKNFKQSFGMNVISKLYVILTVDTKTVVNNQEITNQYVSDFSISLGDKVAVVSENNKDVKFDSVKQESSIVEDKINIQKLIVSTIAMGISAYIIYSILSKTKKYNVVKNEYNLELNRILKSCQDRIVVVKNNDVMDTEDTIEVKDFGELIKLSEELYKPILCWISDDINNEQACFSVISNKIRYRYILKK